MFNAPRAAQRYSTAGTNANGFGGSFVDEINNPLAASVYDQDGLDPWSAAPTPSPPPMPISTAGGFSSVIADATVPPIYNKAFTAVDSAGLGEVSVNSLSRVLATSSLPAATVDRIVNLVSSRPRVSKLEFFVALALVALAQSGSDISVEQVAALASENNLPEPSLNLDTIQPSASNFAVPYSNYRQNSGPVRAPTVSYPDDPWSAPRFPAGQSDFSGGGAATAPRNATANGTSSVAGSGLPHDWWRKQESVHVSIQGQQGFLLNKYTVYEVTTDKGTPVHRRYSEFVFLWDCLVRRYPFRLLPALPPKRVQPDASFTEQRRKGLMRFLNFVVNHPAIKEDGLLAVFLTEPALEAWRKHNSVSLEEESASKRVDRIEEMTIPSDLEDKLAIVKGKIIPLIEQWQKICVLAERIIRRREAAAVRVPSNLRRSFLPSHFAFHLFAPAPASRIAARDPASLRPSPTTDDHMASSTASIMTGSTLFADGNADHAVSDDQADLARLTNVFRVVAEVNERCWRGDSCELCEGVRQGIEHIATHTGRQSDLVEQRTNALLYSTLESLKSQRDLYIATRDLFIRHDRLSGDSVEKLKKRVDTNSMKMEGVKAAQKDRWQEEADRIAALIGKDQATIQSLLARRVFIRACMWHELRVVLHNRENALLSQAAQQFARDEQSFVENVLSNWTSLQDAVENMPYE
ncbi:hypothetical protein CONPUDRAFT_127418 [Coniophora puteana RWD-64-598 SS2]|uniref:Sorting nexin MVP1 n=1 Tax=Coniophora puteana (strain RWD-64-598) TaxID=741705 RepID=A0A5M3MJD9_CONPW|nr:uncharacterized protein CONPUDRAFT_127418 [Coniophora puteana RWD-64-598 SS2]EIW79358.1 hypothetical protein CONPUDRAFT_127418 [Coniophora puteana RWD-64-598 SS2]